MKFWKSKKQREAYKKYKYYINISKRCQKYASWAEEKALEFYIIAFPNKYDKRGQNGG